MESQPHTPEVQLSERSIRELSRVRVVGIGRRSLERLIQEEDNLRAQGLESSLPFYLSKQDKSLRALSADLGIGRHVLGKVFDFYEIPRLSQKEASSRVLENLKKDPEYRQKVYFEINAERMRRIHHNPEVQKKRVESLTATIQSDKYKKASSERAKARWNQPGYKEKVSQNISNALKKKWEARFLDAAIKRAQMEEDPAQKEKLKQSKEAFENDTVLSSIPFEDFKGISVATYERLLKVERELASKGYVEGLPKYLRGSNTSLRQLSLNLRLSKSVLNKIFDQFSIPRLEHSQSVKRALSKMKNDEEYWRKRNEGISARQKEKWADSQYRENMLDTRRERNKLEDPILIEKRKEELRKRLETIRQNPEIQKRRLESLRKRWEDPVFREKRTAEIRAVNARPEYREKNLKALKKLWADPEFRDKRLESVKSALSNEENRQRQRSAIQEVWADPEFRKRQANSARKVITRLNQETNQLEKAAAGIRKTRSEPNSAERFHLPTIQGFRKDIGYFAQSAWEANFARILTHTGRQFYTKENFILEVTEEYRSLFKFEITQFTVDFIVEDPRGNIVAYDLIAHPLEEPVGLAKAEMFKIQHPEIRLHIIDADLYGDLALAFRDKIDSDENLCGWESSEDNLRINPSKYM